MTKDEIIVLTRYLIFILVWDMNSKVVNPQIQYIKLSVKFNIIYYDKTNSFNRLNLV